LLRSFLGGELPLFLAFHSLRPSSSSSPALQELRVARLTRSLCSAEQDGDGDGDDGGAER
jgi:hypothetical protein